MDLEPSPYPDPISWPDVFANLGLTFGTFGQQHVWAQQMALYMKEKFNSDFNRIVMQIPVQAGKKSAADQITEKLKEFGISVAQINGQTIMGIDPASPSWCALTDLKEVMDDVDDKMKKKDISQGIVRNQGPRQRTFQRRGMR